MKGKMRYFIAGMLAALVLTTIVTPALAAGASRLMEVWGGVTIYIDDQKLDPRDVNGNPIDPFVSNGTTYLPIRAISEALGKPVQWDGKTRSVYIGKHAGDKPAVWVKDLDYYLRNDYDHDFVLKNDETDNLGNKYNNVISREEGVTGSVWRTIHDSLWYSYIINGQYSRITGVLFQPYSARASSKETKLTIYGDNDEILYSASVRGGENYINPIPFDVDISGVLTLKIELSGHYESDWNTYYTYGCIGDLGLWT